MRENGRYRFARVYRGENWNPDLKAPLTQPGVNVVAGEYLLAREWARTPHPPDSVYAFFESTGDKSVVIRVGADALWSQFARSHGQFQLPASSTCAIGPGWTTTAEASTG